MKRTRTKLAICAGIAALLGLSATASATLRDTVVLYAMGGTQGHLYQDSNYDTIYAAGEVYDSNGMKVCEARSERHGEWGVSNGSCAQGELQLITIRTSSMIYYMGVGVSFPNRETAFTYGNISSRDEGGPCCTDRQFLGYAYAID